MQFLTGFQIYSVPRLNRHKIRAYQRFIKHLGTMFASDVPKHEDKLDFIKTVSLVIQFFNFLDLTSKEKIYLQHIQIFCLFLEKDQKAIDQTIELYNDSLKSRSSWKKFALEILFENISFYFEKTQDVRLREVILKEWKIQPESERNYFYGEGHLYLLKTISILVDDQQTLAVY